MLKSHSYAFGYEFNDDLEVVPVARVRIPLKEKSIRTPFTHYQERYTYARGVLTNNLYLEQ